MFRKNKSPIANRLLVDLTIFAAVFWFPWWVSILLATWAFFFFTEFVELVFVGLVIDTLYAPHQFFSAGSYRYFGTCLLLFLVLSLIRRQLR